jgi:riboflavin kinase/FMN adenylyltransferase
MIAKIATIGFFDGVHLGHRCLFAQLRQWAEDLQQLPVVYTFPNHPKESLEGQETNMRLVTTLEERECLLSKEAEMRFLPFESIRQMTAEAFMRRLYSEGVRTILMGYDHRFGSDCLTDIDAYISIGESVGIQVIRAKELSQDSSCHVSSSNIRKCLMEGNVERANQMLGYDYCISGVVVPGNSIGRQLGFPTANLSVCEKKLIPKCGVYQAKVSVISQEGDSAVYNALVNIGDNPTIGNHNITIEAHLINYSQDLYNQPLEIRLQRYLRAERKFSSLHELQQQIAIDLQGVIVKE